MFIRIPFEAIVTQFSDLSVKSRSGVMQQLVRAQGTSLYHTPTGHNMAIRERIHNFFTKTYAGCTQFIDPFVGGINTGSMYVR